MKLHKLKSIIREAVKKQLSENQPAPAKPKTQPSTKPGQPKPAQPRRTFDPKPGVNPKPKAMTEGEKEIVDKIVQRMRSKKEMNEAESSTFKIDPKLAGKIHDILEKEGINTGMTKTFFFHFLNDRL